MKNINLSNLKKLLALVLTAAMLFSCAAIAPSLALAANVPGYPFLLGAARGANNEIVPLISYRPGQSTGTVPLDGRVYDHPLNETIAQFKTHPISGHPDGTAYIWAYDDASNIYFIADWTSDNTYDDGDDYFTVYINDTNGLRSYTQYSDRGKYGEALFTKTAVADFDHMYYVIAVPKQQLTAGIIKVGFELYGTAAVSGSLAWGAAPPATVPVGSPVSFDVSYRVTAWGNQSYSNTAVLVEYANDEALYNAYYDFIFENGAFEKYSSGGYVPYEGTDIKILGTKEFTTAFTGSASEYNELEGNVSLEGTFAESGAHKVSVLVFSNYGGSAYYPWAGNLITATIGAGDAYWVADSTGITGEGTASSPYGISNGNQLAYISSFNGSGAYIQLESDINLAGKLWMPISLAGSTEGDSFVLEGNGHSISNLKVNDTVYLGTTEQITAIRSGYSYNDEWEYLEATVSAAAMFSRTQNAAISNIILNSPEVVLASSATTSVSLGGALVGLAEGGELRGITVNTPSITTQSIDSYSSGTVLGGVVGYASELKPISDASVSGGCVSATVSNSYQTLTAVGGIAGAAYSSVLVNTSSAAKLALNVCGDGAVEAAFVGGIVGTISAEEKLSGFFCLHNSYSRSKITLTVTESSYANAAYAGGLAGYLNDAAINNYYKGTVSIIAPGEVESSHSGALFGYVYNPADKYDISRNYITDESLAIGGFEESGTEPAVEHIANANTLAVALNGGREAVASGIYAQYGEEVALNKVFEWEIVEGKNDGFPVLKAPEEQAKKMKTVLSWEKNPPTSTVTGTPTELALKYTLTNAPASINGKAYLFEYDTEEHLSEFLDGFPLYFEEAGCFGRTSYAEGGDTQFNTSCDCSSCVYASKRQCCINDTTPYDGIEILASAAFTATSASGAVPLTANFASHGGHKIAAVVYWQGSLSVFVNGVEADTITVYSKAGVAPIKTAISSAKGIEIIRISNLNRIEVANDIAKLGWQSSDTVILAYGRNFADALAGAPLAKALDAPILLTNNCDELESTVIETIQTLEARNVIILGGESVVKAEFAAQLEALELNVSRYAGKNRYETAVDIADALIEAGKAFDTIFLADGLNFPDALSAAPVAAILEQPILFTNSTNKNNLEAATAEYIKKAGIKNVVILGGTGLISPTIAGKLQAQGLKVNRIAGINRYETAVKINKEYAEIFTGEAISFTTGTSFPDALAGSAFAARIGAPLYLLQNGEAFANVKAAIAAINPDTAYVFGGTAALDEKTVKINLP